MQLESTMRVNESLLIQEYLGTSCFEVECFIPESFFMSWSLNGFDHTSQEAELEWREVEFSELQFRSDAGALPP